MWCLPCTGGWLSYHLISAPSIPYSYSFRLTAGSRVDPSARFLPGASRVCFLCCRSPVPAALAQGTGTLPLWLTVAASPTPRMLSGRSKGLMPFSAFFPAASLRGPGAGQNNLSFPLALPSPLSGLAPHIFHSVSQAQPKGASSLITSFTFKLKSECFPPTTLFLYHLFGVLCVLCTFHPRETINSKSTESILLKVFHSI